MKLKNTSLGIFFFMFLNLVVGRNISSNSSERRSISPTFTISSYTYLSQYTNTIDARHSDITASIRSYDLTSSVQITPTVIPTTTQTRYYGYNSSAFTSPLSNINTTEVTDRNDTTNITSFDLKSLTSSIQITPTVIPTTQTRYYGNNSTVIDRNHSSLQQQSISPTFITSQHTSQFINVTNAGSSVQIIPTVITTTQAIHYGFNSSVFTSPMSTKSTTTTRTIQTTQYRLNSTGFCLNETIGTEKAYGIFRWPNSLVRNTSYKISCPYNSKSYATRKCRQTNETRTGGAWDPIDAGRCEFKNHRSKNLFILTQNDVNSSNIVEIFEDIFTTIDNILDASSENIFESQQKTNSSSRILDVSNNLAENIQFEGNNLTRVKKNYAINLQIVHPQNFNGLSFSGTVKQSQESLPLMRNSIALNLNVRIPPDTTASLSIPKSLFDESTINNNNMNNRRAIFAFYKETKFFTTSIFQERSLFGRLNSLVIAGSIKGLTIRNLETPVEIALKEIEPGNTTSAKCSFWDFKLSKWSQEGCSFIRTLEDGRILCSCDHLTNFAMLMDIYPEKTHDLALSIISYIGCALSLIGLILTIIVVLMLRELRNLVPNQILVNFCIALSLTLIVFLAAGERSRTASFVACRVAAIALHYFLLAALFWMTVEAFNMYLAFVNVFPISNPSSFMKRCFIFAWGCPLIIVSITMATSLDKYGDNTYCQLKGVPFIIGFFTPTVIIIFFNLVAFLCIIRSLYNSGNNVTSNQKISGFTQARQGIAIMVLLGLTWIFGILAIDDAKRVFQYLFAIFNTLQGFFVFLFFIILPSGTRNHLRQFMRKKTKRYTKSNEKRAGKTAKQNNVNNVWNTNSSSTPNAETEKVNLYSMSDSSPTKVKSERQQQHVTLAIDTSNQDSFNQESKSPEQREILPATALEIEKLPPQSISLGDPVQINIVIKNASPENQKDDANFMNGDKESFENLDSTVISSPTVDKQQQQTPLVIDSSKLHGKTSDVTRFPDAVFINPNVTRYSVRQNGPNYRTTIELDLKPYEHGTVYFPKKI
ncbi:adhesion G-protein coupled receptor G6-like isoform X2 [Xenia sp. Carnegie-2017]|uniref:adhesion G-protein coupled receptor G6-like isoform X2 n=1 Tax=Xenia sp. Carnegie-2017 TaxID=2897299 RepID=UPI001F0359A5|nr:adhesion G-protein coupled receptor G6-like isoform X2 [Xenia sp. Carnegie-2017]